MRAAAPLLLLAAVVPSVASAASTCPASETVLSELTCSSSITGHLNYTDTSDLGGTARTAMYSCGRYAPLPQTGMEDVYSFTCQSSGSVTLNITALDCDLDIYILDDTCDPFYGCVAASDELRTSSDSVTFTCAAGATYYVVIEGYGFTQSPAYGTGYCSGASEGDYQLSFDVSRGTGCSEDCDNGTDDDLDGDIDCADSDCADDPICNCDEDADGYDGASCGGDDCNDSNALINPGMDEYCNGYDDDCDGVTDESD